MRRQIFLYPVPSRNVLFFAWLTTVHSKITAIADIERLSFALSAYSASAYTSSPRPDTTPLEFLEPFFQQQIVDSFGGSFLFLRPPSMRQQGVRGVRIHLMLLRLGPRASALKCGYLPVPLLSVRFSPRECGDVPSAGAGVAAGSAAAVSAAAASAAAAAAAAAAGDSAATVAVDATEIGPPGGDRWCRGVVFRAPAAPAPNSAAGASPPGGGRWCWGVAFRPAAPAPNSAGGASPPGGGRGCLLRCASTSRWASCRQGRTRCPKPLPPPPPP